MARNGYSPKKKTASSSDSGEGIAPWRENRARTGADDWRPSDAGRAASEAGKASLDPAFENGLLEAFRSAGEAMIAIDAAGTIRFWNAGAERLFGFGASEVIGTGWGPLLEGGASMGNPPGTGPAFGNLTGTGVRKDGTRFALEFSMGAGAGTAGLSVALVRARKPENAGENATTPGESPRLATPEDLENRIRFDNLITSISTHFIHLPGDRIDMGINYALRALGEFAEVDRSYIFLFSEDQGTVANTHEWCSKGAEPQIGNLGSIPVSRFPWFMERMRGLQTVHVPSVSLLPAEAAAEREEFEREGIQSLVIVPMVHRGVLRGYLGFDSVRPGKVWAAEIVQALRMAGEIFINALERKRVDQALSEAKAKYLNIFENAVEGIFQTTPEGRFLSANPALARILGYADAGIMMREVSDTGAALYVCPDRRAEFLRILLERGRLMDFESQVRRKDGTVIWISENARAVLRPDGELDFCEGTVMDVTQRKGMEEELRHGAFHDALTGLPNRALLMERLDRALERSRRKPGDLCAVLFLDVDRFKMVNDSMGHLQGDRLLIAISRRLEAFVPPGTTLARLGGDEFCMLLEELKDFGQATQLADRLREALSVAFELDDRDIYAAVSIGIAVGGDQTPGPEELLRDADTAMHRAKAAGKGRFEVFVDSMHTKAVQLLTLETDMRRALERMEFRIHYQPIVSLENSALMGFEALIRWKHPRFGLVSPADFIPLAEDTGLIVPIGKWVLWQSCKQLVEWQRLSQGGRTLTMSVNLSGRQLQDLDLTRQIGSILAETGAAASSLKLEVTESAIMESPDKAAEILTALRNMGIQLSLDDFGTGYSSLSYLHRFPFHNLKIDRSFVSKLEDSGKDAEIVKVINSLAFNLGMEVVAEGIETEGQWALLHGLSCAYGQGYFFSRPLEELAAGKLIAAGGFAPAAPPLFQSQSGPTREPSDRPPLQNR